MTKSLSGTSDTGHLSDHSYDRGCPCGRFHPDTRPYRRSPPNRTVDHKSLVDTAYDAVLAGKATTGDGNWTLHFAGKCSRPVRKFMLSDGYKGAHVELRCRRCPDCLRARMWYWALAGMEETRKAHEAGRRTWFGTLTYSPQAQEQLVRRARTVWADTMAHEPTDDSWWEEALCDFRFDLVAKQVTADIQRYWKRLRKQGHKLRYLVVIERHKTGLPHVHWLVHETDAPIRKRQLQAAWPFGHTNVTIVGGKSRRAAAPEKAAWYVVKYLSKAVQSRQKASQNYRPPKRKRG